MSKNSVPKAPTIQQLTPPHLAQRRAKLGFYDVVDPERLWVQIDLNDDCIMTHLF